MTSGPPSPRNSRPCALSGITMSTGAEGCVSSCLPIRKKCQFLPPWDQQVSDMTWGQHVSTPNSDVPSLAWQAAPSLLPSCPPCWARHVDEHQEGSVPTLSAADPRFQLLTHIFGPALRKYFIWNVNFFGTFHWNSPSFSPIIHLADYYEGGPCERIGKCHLNKRSPRKERA